MASYNSSTPLYRWADGSLHHATQSDDGGWVPPYDPSSGEGDDRSAGTLVEDPETIRQYQLAQLGSPLKQQLYTEGNMGEGLLQGTAGFLEGKAPEGFDWTNSIRQAWNKQQGQFNSWSSFDDAGQSALKVLSQISDPWARVAEQQVRSDPAFATGQAESARDWEYDRADPNKWDDLKFLAQAATAIGGGFLGATSAAAGSPLNAGAFAAEEEATLNAMGNLATTTGGVPTAAVPFSPNFGGNGGVDMPPISSTTPAGTVPLGPDFGGNGSLDIPPGTTATAPSVAMGAAGTALASGVGTAVGAAGKALVAGESGDLLSKLFNIGTGLYGLNAAGELSDAGKEAQAAADPFGPNRAGYASQLSTAIGTPLAPNAEYRSAASAPVTVNPQYEAAASSTSPVAAFRDIYSAKLNELYANPNEVIPNLPGYEAGIQAVERRQGAQGYTGSGNMAVALQKAVGGDFYQQALANLMNLTGMGSNAAQTDTSNLAGLDAAQRNAQQTRVSNLSALSGAETSTQQQNIANLMTLSGANINPATGADMKMTGDVSSLAAIRAALDRIGYGVTGTTPTVPSTPKPAAASAWNSPVWGTA